MTKVTARGNQINFEFSGTMRNVFITVLLFITEILCWELIQPSTPRRSLLNSCVVHYQVNSESYILSHGGQVDYNYTAQSDLWRYSVADSSWEQLTTSGSPNLTTHSCVYKKPTNSVLFCGYTTRKSLYLLLQWSGY